MRPTKEQLRNRHEETVLLKTLRELAREDQAKYGGCERCEDAFIAGAKAGVKMKLKPELKKQVRNKVLKDALGPVLRRAFYVTKDLCRNSCGPGKGNHMAECIADRLMDKRAREVFKTLS